jgi:gluconolactonase
MVAGAEVVRLADGFSFTEGPAADSAGHIFFSDVPSQRVYRWSLGGELSVFRSASGGANGLFFDPKGNLIACEMETRAITETTPSGEVSVLADRYEGLPFNATNDVWVAPNGGIYFSDPDYKHGGNGDTPRQDGNHVYYIPQDRSTVVRVIDDLAYPNGLVGTADGRMLYVADRGSAKTLAYEIGPDGTLSNRRIAADTGYDGISLDEHENLYVAHEAVEIYSPDGRRIGTIETPEPPSNVTFGGVDGRTLFITARSSLYSIRMNVRGQHRK